MTIPHPPASPSLDVAESPTGRRSDRAKRGRARFFPDATDGEWNDWKWQFRNRITRLEELAAHLPFPETEWAMRREVLRDFRMGITPYYLALVDPDDAADPILRQITPIVEEFVFREVGDEDPLAEEGYSPVPGITHRYPDRVLMVISNSCAIYCRYCTRKRIMYEDAVPDVEIDRMVEYIARTPAVRDVVVSGGDPLTCGTRKLEGILAKLRAIPHLEIIRIGSRVPVALPQRIDAELCDVLARFHPLWVNVHFNHPRELSAEAAAACDRLSRAGIPLNNQAVLLKGVNDDVETMRALCTGLLKMRVRPYYLYQCDPIRGGEHFRTPISKGIEIMEALRGHTSGLAVPTYVVDAPGGGGKIPVGPNYLLHHDAKKKRAVLRNFQGRIFEYREPTGRAGPMTSKARRGGGELKTAAARSTPRASLPEGNGQASSNGKPKRAAGGSGWVHRGRSLEDRISQPKV